MLYRISVSVGFPSTSEMIEAKDIEAAKKIAVKMEVVKRKEITPTVANIRSTVHESDENWTYKTDAIYLIKRYSSYLPAKCIISHRIYRYRKFEHIFKFFGAHKRVTFYGKNPVKIIRKLCDKGEIGKPECGDCPAKFKCYTVKKV